MNEVRLDDYQWLAGEGARPYLWQAASSRESLTCLAKALRRQIHPRRARLVMEQAALRQRARAKFKLADTMLLTREGIEQATDELIASHKALRFEGLQSVADMCCGIGGDLMGLASRCDEAVGIDRDPIVALCGATNCQVRQLRNVRISTADVRQFSVESCHAWHLDPSRRQDGRRTVGLEHCSPDVAWIQTALKRNENAAIKLAPATIVPPSWSESAERQWIGRAGECKQQIAWFGVIGRQIGCNVATVLGADGSVLGQVSGQANVVLSTSSIRRYLFEPHPAVLAAALTGCLAHKHALAAVHPQIAYLTGDSLVDDGCLAAFEVLAVMPLDVHRVRQWLRQRGIGRLELKKRGVAIDLQHLGKQLSGPGTRTAVLFAVRTGERVNAVLATRMQMPHR